MWLEFFVLLSVAVYAFHRWATKNHDYFKKRGLPHQKPILLFGDMWSVILRRKSFLDVIIDLYNNYDGKVYGIFDQRNPVILLRDPEIIKQITIKDFDHFINHRTTFGDESDENNLFGSSLFMMKDDRWKDMRNTLSPAFTGSKMRLMFQLMDRVARETVTYLKKQSMASDNQGGDVDVKDFVTRYTNDVIASTAFGLEVNSFEHQNNDFYMAGKKVTNFNFWQNIKFFLYVNMKHLMKLLGIELFDKKASQYFRRLVLDTMKYRQDHGIVRNDMINMLMEAKGLLKGDTKPSNREWSDTDIVAQCFLFFFAGFETTASATSFMAHEIMENSEVQEKLLREIHEIESQLEGKPITYEKIQNMRYLDMVLSETLRKWGGAIVMDRICTKDISYDLRDGLKLYLKKGDCVWIPAGGLHYDPKYFENPKKFDPERFSEENKDNIKPFTYLPFGMGPRNCIGSRFAQLETKVLIYYLLRDFRLEASKKSCVPLTLSSSGFQLMPKGGFWLKFVSRN